MTDIEKIHPAVPDVYIIGAQRSGTSWLYEALRQHPDVWGPEVAPEPKTFIPRVIKTATGGKLFKRLVLDELEQAGYFNAPAGKVLVEKTTRYLTDPAACLALQRANPKAKIIVIARNPGDRAWSHWRYSVSEGWEYREFKAAVAVEPMRATQRKMDFHKFAYVGNGLVAAHILRGGWASMNVLLLKYEELDEPGSLLLRVQRFLGLEPHTFDFPGLINEGEPMEDYFRTHPEVIEVTEHLDWMLEEQVDLYDRLIEEQRGV